MEAIVLHQATDRACKGVILMTLEVWWHANMTTKIYPRTVFFLSVYRIGTKSDSKTGTHIDLGTIEAILVNHTVNKKNKTREQETSVLYGCTTSFTVEIVVLK